MSVKISTIWIAEFILVFLTGICASVAILYNFEGLQGVACDSLVIVFATMFAVVFAIDVELDEIYAELRGLWKRLEKLEEKLEEVNSDGQA